jgi:DNA-binding transcriptional LysR family regulator
MQSCRTFVQTGSGIGLLPDFIGAHGAAPLVRVLPDIASAPISARFVYPAQRFLPRGVRAFIDLARKAETRQADAPTPAPGANTAGGGAPDALA